MHVSAIPCRNAEASKEGAIKSSVELLTTPSRNGESGSRERHACLAAVSIFVRRVSWFTLRLCLASSLRAGPIGPLLSAAVRHSAAKFDGGSGSQDRFA